MLMIDAVQRRPGQARPGQVGGTGGILWGGIILPALECPLCVWLQGIWFWELIIIK